MATLLPSNFSSNSLSGTVTVRNGFANISLTATPYAFEGDKQFTIKLRRNSINGPVLLTLPTQTIRDNSSFVSLTANTSTVNEGNLVQFTLVTANTSDYANVYFSVLPKFANVTSSDFTANTGMVTIVNNTGIFALKANADLSLMDESGETFSLQLRTNSTTGNIVYVTSNIIIADTSRFYNIYSFIPSGSAIADGSSITFTINSSAVPAGTSFYFDTVGNVTNASFTTGNTGTVILNSYSNTITLTANTGSIPAGETRNFSLRLKDFASSGSTTFATSSEITIVNSDYAYITATGGTITDNAGYRTHIFTSNGIFNLSVTGISTYSNVEYLIVAGGGGGGVGAPAPRYYGGGGGGAGGVLVGNLTVTSTFTTNVLVGSGGSGFFTSTSRGGNGSPSVFYTLTAIGGGGGGGVPAFTVGAPGHPGGSGGGAGGSDVSDFPTNYTTYTGQGTPGQGYPGGAGTLGGNGYAFSGGGGGGAGGPGHATPTDPTAPQPATTARGGDGIAVPSIAPPAYGTPGPTPGRWFGGGGGGGDTPTFTASFMAGGAGGGGAGGGPPTSPEAGPNYSGANAIINTGGGGGGVSAGGVSVAPPSIAGSGAPGIIILRYPFGAKVYNSITSTTDGGGNVTFILNTVNAQGATLYYSTVGGNINVTDIIGGNTGSFVVPANNSSTFKLVANTASLVGTKTFQLQIRVESVTGLIRYTSGNATIGVPLYPLATGGNEVLTANGYTTHYFISSNTFVISALGSLSSNIEIVAIAGGGGGGTGSYGAGGGGAGGVLWSNITLQNIGNITITVGGGGTATAGAGPSALNNGGNTLVTAPSAVYGSANLIAVGGGGGSGYNQNPQGYYKGANGGSGGGGHNLTVPGLAAASGYGYPGTMFVTQQGYPAGDGINGGGTTGGGGGAGQQGGSGPAVSGNPGGYGGNGISISWVTPSYGTPGPTPGRWFGGGGAGGKENGPGIVVNGGAGGGGTNTGILNQAGFAGNTNTGGGGSGMNTGGGQYTGALGGSGIVIIRYPS